MGKNAAKFYYNKEDCPRKYSALRGLVEQYMTYCTSRSAFLNFLFIPMLIIRKKRYDRHCICGGFHSDNWSEER